LHLVGSSVLLYLIDDARSNKNQAIISLTQLYVLRIPLLAWFQASTTK